MDEIEIRKRRKSYIVDYFFSEHYPKSKKYFFLEVRMPIAKITRKGQVTIPVEIRKKLGTDIVEITIREGEVVIKPVKKLGGVLHEYAIKGKPIEEVMKMEKEAMVDAIREKHLSD